MKKYLKEYISELESITKKCSLEELNEIMKKIEFFQHERLIHLMVTLFYVFLTIAFMVLGMLTYLFLIPFFILIVFDLFYILHYFYLENGVQYLYKLYDKLKK